MSGYFLAKHATLSGPVSTRPRSASALEPIPLVLFADFIMLFDPQTIEERHARWAVPSRAQEVKGAVPPAALPATNCDSLPPSKPREDH